MNELKIHNYKFTFKDDYIVGCCATSDKDCDFVGQMAKYPDVLNSFPEGWYKFENGEFMLDSEKKSKEIEQRNKKERLITLHNYLNETDYITARAFEEVMALNNPLTFVTDMIAILVKYATQYKDVIAQRKIVRAEIEDLEKE